MTAPAPTPATPTVPDTGTVTFVCPDCSAVQVGSARVVDAVVPARCSVCLSHLWLTRVAGVVVGIPATQDAEEWLALLRLERVRARCASVGAILALRYAAADPDAWTTGTDGGRCESNPGNSGFFSGTDPESGV